MKKEIIDKVLSIGTSKDEYRYWMNNPFTIGEYSYSTDAHIILRVPKECANQFEGLEKETYINNILKFFSVDREKIGLLNVSLLIDAVSKVPLIDEYSNCDETGKCEECDGDGEVEWEYGSWSKDFDCPVCDGDGNITESKRQKTGRKVKSNCNFDLFDRNFSLTNVEKLIEISTLLESESIELVSQQGYTSLFKIGILEIVVASMSECNESEVIKIQTV